MTTTTASTAAADTMLQAPRRRVCFSFAAYAKAVVAHFHASGVPVAAGLSEAEFSAIESAYDFEFPPDIRSILREGLPIGPGFPHWRSASPQQLRLLLGLPVASLLHEISEGGFWPGSWGPRPRDSSLATATASVSLRRAPPLVPIYRNFYIPASPSLAGNPVFYVRGSDVRLAGLDLADFFRRERPRGWAAGGPAPAWAATSARRVEVWSDLVEEDTWLERKRSGGSLWEERVERGLEEAGQLLREGGWSEEEVEEMMAVESDSDDWDWAVASAVKDPTTTVLRKMGGVLRQLRLLSLALFRGGWSGDDVVEAMGWTDTGSEEGQGGAGNIDMA